MTGLTAMTMAAIAHQSMGKRGIDQKQ